MRAQNSYTADQLRSMQGYAKMGLKASVIKRRMEADYAPAKFPSGTICFYMKKAKICEDVAIRKAGSGRKVSVRTDANVERVLNMFKTGERSLRKISKDIDIKISRTSICRIVRDAGLEPPKQMQKLVSTTPNSKSKRKASSPKKSLSADSIPATAQFVGSTDAQSSSTLDIPLVSNGGAPAIVQLSPLPAALFETDFGVSTVYQPLVSQQFQSTVSGSNTADDTDPGLTSTRHATNAQIYCDQASRALHFSDYSSAVVNLKLALNELGSVGFH